MSLIDNKFQSSGKSFFSLGLKFALYEIHYKPQRLQKVYDQGCQSHALHHALHLVLKSQLFNQLF